MDISTICADLSIRISFTVYIKKYELRRDYWLILKEVKSCDTYCTSCHFRRSRAFIVRRIMCSGKDITLQYINIMRTKHTE